MKLEIKKKLADKWFSDLQILICKEFLKLEKNLSFINPLKYLYKFEKNKLKLYERNESKKFDKIVLVKNPVNPDLSLWLGAIERLQSANISRLGLIHRGFSSQGKSKYRNNPEWQIAIDLQRKLPDLPLILDPSHIAGRRDLIFDLCQTALDLNYDGLMIETHNDPDNAWSDSKQQITPKNLKELTKNLTVRRITNNDEVYLDNLDSLRAQINVHDNQLINILGNRMKVAEKIGLLKKKNNVAVLQSKRWNEILGNMILEGEEKNLSEEFILKVFKAIHQESINHQENILKNN